MSAVPVATESSFAQWWSKTFAIDGADCMRRVSLLKAIEKETGALWAKSALGAKTDAAEAAQLKAVVGNFQRCILCVCLCVLQKDL